MERKKFNQFDAKVFFINRIEKQDLAQGNNGKLAGHNFFSRNPTADRTGSTKQLTEPVLQNRFYRTADRTGSTEQLTEPVLQNS